MDRGAWWATLHGVAKSWIQLSDKHFHFSPRIQQEYKVRGFSKSGIGLQHVWYPVAMSYVHLQLRTAGLEYANFCWVWDFIYKLLRFPVNGLMDSGRRHETPWSETQDFITHVTENSMSIKSQWVSFVPTSHRGDIKSPERCYTCRGFMSQPEEHWIWGNPFSP